MVAAKQGEQLPGRSRSIRRLGIQEYNRQWRQVGTDLLEEFSSSFLWALNAERRKEAQ